MPLHSFNFDTVLVGGGLANSLIALGLLKCSPQRSLALVEGAPRLGGNHTWSFHMSDVADVARSFVEPLVECRWSGYSVKFPRLRRSVAQEYASFTSERLHGRLVDAFRPVRESQLILGKRAISVDAHRVLLDDGSVLGGALVIDGRGPERYAVGPDSRYQKFVGLELQLERAAPVDKPLLMDACVSQRDGFRFMYVLPFSDRRVLIEDTYFSDTSELDEAASERRTLAYARDNGYVVASVLRRERGVLPLPVRTPTAQLMRGPLVSGYQGGWFHPTTGYSFPAAARLAEFVAKRSAGEVFGPDLANLLKERRVQQRYFCFLNSLLYGAFAPEQRFNVLQRFYGLPAETIARFYAMRTTSMDRARILCGRPPTGLSLRRALSMPSNP